jgi:hypothetical protein
VTVIVANGPQGIQAANRHDAHRLVFAQNYDRTARVERDVVP